MTGPILAADHWPTNAHLIAAIHQLGHLTNTHTLDPTYGRGKWWTHWQPDQLTTHDLRTDHVDFRDLPYPDGHFPQAVYDPPYVVTGGRRTSKIGDMNDRYGLHELPRTPPEGQTLINTGLTEIVRVTRPGGTIAVKCMDYISSGQLWAGTHHTLTHALAADLTLVDRIEHLGRPGPQPAGRRQVHARRNLSTLFIFQTPRRQAP